MLSPAVIGLLITTSIFLFGLAFNAGRISARVDRLEKDRDEMKQQGDRLFDSLRRIESLIAEKGRS